MDTKNSKNTTEIENGKEEKMQQKIRLKEAKKHMEEPKWGRDWKTMKIADGTHQKITDWVRRSLQEKKEKKKKKKKVRHKDDLDGKTPTIYKNLPTTQIQCKWANHHRMMDRW